MQRSIARLITRIFCGLAATLIAFAVPAPLVFAEGSDPSGSAASACSLGATPPAGIHQPTGSDAVTYSYNSCTGLFENPYYTWNPDTQVATPKVPLVYTCDTTGWDWATERWEYNPAAQAFFQATIHQINLPENAMVATDSIIPCAPTQIAPVVPASATPTTTANTTTTSDTNTNNVTNANLANAIGSVAVTGAADVTDNTAGGNAQTGNATAIANVLNAVQSSSALDGGNVTTFVANINGDVQGNLIIDPSQLQPTTDSTALNNANLDVNNQTNGQITNTIALNADTGNANVADNTSAGNATTGNATAIADVVNMLNSIVGAGKSFVGVVNINGNLNGDILMPQSFLDSLIASNAPSTTLSLSPTAASNLGATSTNNLATTNAVTASATTGTAAVDNNTSAGNATTGNASTNVRVFNLTGNQVVGANCLLVFVNVSGTWVGVIMDAPMGSTAAALGSGISANGVSGDATNATNDAITNNINISAASGDATVAGNTTGGNATTGNADTAVNLLNMNNSSFNLSGWFGVLFINVFGNWYGSFSAIAPVIATSNDTPIPPAAPAPAPMLSQTFRFVRSVAVASSAADDNTPVFTAASAHIAGRVLGSTAPVVHLSSAPTQSSASIIMELVSAGLVMLGISALVIERAVSHRSLAHVHR